MKITELFENTGFFAAINVPVLLLCGAHKIKKGALAVKSTAHRTTTDAVDIVRRGLGLGFEVFPGQRLATHGRP